MTPLAAATVQVDSEILQVLPGLNRVGWGFDARTQTFVEKQIFQGTSQDETQAAELITTIGGTDYLRPPNLTTTSESKSFESLAYGASVQEFKNEYNANANMEVGYGGCDMQARFSIDETSEESQEHVYAAKSKRVILFRNTVASTTRGQLTGQAKAAIDDMGLSPKDLFAAWGTHVLMSAGIGGTYELNAHLKKSSNFKEEDIAAGISAKGKAMGIDFNGAADYSSVSSELRTQLDANSLTTQIGGVDTPNLEAWVASVSVNAQPIEMVSLIPISELAEGRRKADLESALAIILNPGLTGVGDFRGSIIGPGGQSAEDLHVFVSPTKFGFVSPEHAGDDALLSFSLPAPTAQGLAMAAWNVSGSYFQVKHRDSKDHPDDGSTYVDGRFHHALVPRVSARVVEIFHGQRVKIDGVTVKDGTGKPVVADLEKGVVIYPTDLHGARITDAASCKRWQLVIAPSSIGESEPGSNSYNALLGYECTATADTHKDGTNLQWTVTGTYRYRYDNSGHQETRPAAAVRCLLLENPEDDVKTALYQTGFVEDGQDIGTPTGECKEWFLLLSPVRMGNNQGGGDHYAMLQAECSARAAASTWKVSAKCVARRKSGLNDGDKETVKGRCNYLIIRRPGA